MTNKESKYYLNIGEADKERLDILNDLYNPPTQELLLKVGLKPGMRVLDVACGTGIMTKWLAQQVGPTGHVHAIDQSIEQLDIAQQYISDHKNITLEKRSVYDLKVLDQTYDAIYTRFLLVHLDDPIEALRQMVYCLKPSGIIAIVSALHEAHYSLPECKAFNRLFELGLGIIGQNNRDPHWGKQLIPALKPLGINLRQASTFMPILHTQYQKAFLKSALKTFEDQLLQQGITRDHLNTLYNEFDKFSNDPNSYCTFLDCILVSGIKLGT